MKGYLERLIRTVSNPTESVRPFAGSVFVAGRQDDFHVARSGESVPHVSAKPSVESISPDSARSFETPVPSRDSLFRPEYDLSSTKSRKITQGSTQEGQNAHRREPTVNGMDAEPFAPDRERSAEKAAERSGPETSKPKISKPVRRGYEPLVGTEAVNTLGRTDVEFATGSVRFSAKKKDMARNSKSVVADQQADEIQIHIGRIEVTAVHPPAPRPSATRDRDISLDSYLKRRGGRTG
jgi:hypothetical protein